MDELNDKISEDKFDSFWKILYQKTGRIMPTYLKNAMRINGFDDMHTIQLMTNDDVDFLEAFIKTEVESYIKPADDRRDFYHEFHDKVHLFKIVRGHRMKLLELAKFLKDKLASKDGVQFFLKPSDDNGKMKDRNTGISALSQTLNIEKERNDLKARTISWMKTYASGLYFEVLNFFIAILATSIYTAILIYKIQTVHFSTNYLWRKKWWRQELKRAIMECAALRAT